MTPGGSSGIAAALAETLRPRNQKTSERIARDIADFITSRDLPEGFRLPIERELVELFQVGRTTLREALLLLETRGVIRVRVGPSGGPVVRRPRPADLSEALTLMLQFEGATFGDVVQARNALEPTLARLAAPRIDEDTLTVLRGTIETATKSGSEETWVHENQRFHQEIARASSNVPLQVFDEALIFVSEGCLIGVKTPPRIRRSTVDAHERITEALAAHDGEAAARAMRDHLNNSLRHLEHEHPELMSRPVAWVRRGDSLTTERARLKA